MISLPSSDQQRAVSGIPPYYRPGERVWFRGGEVTVLETTIKLDMAKVWLSYTVRFGADVTADDRNGKPYAGRTFMARHEELRPLIEVVPE